MKRQRQRVNDYSTVRQQHAIIELLHQHRFGDLWTLSFIRINIIVTFMLDHLVIDESELYNQDDYIYCWNCNHDSETYYLKLKHILLHIQVIQSAVKIHVHVDTEWMWIKYLFWRYYILCCICVITESSHVNASTAFQTRKSMSMWHMGWDTLWV